MTKTMIVALLATAALPQVAHAQASASAFTSATRYDAARRVTGTIAPDPDGSGPLHHLAVRNTYDQAGRLTKTEKGELQTWQSEAIAPANWPTSPTTGFVVQQQTEFTYDLLGRKLTERTSSGGTAYALTQYSYDPNDRLECTAVRMNPAAFGSLPVSACTPGTPGSQGPDRVTKNLYDTAGQLLQVRQAVGTALEQGHVTYAYTPNGKRSDVIDANGNRAHLTYDGFDRQAQWQFPSASVVSGFNDATPATALSTAGAVNAADYEAYGYDANGNRTDWRKRDGRVFTFAFDALNRMSAKVVPDGCPLVGTGACPAVAATRDVYYGYDVRGLQTYARFDSVSGEGITNGWNGFGELATTTSNMGGVTRTLTHSFNSDGALETVSFPEATGFTFANDGLDRPYYLSSNVGLWYTIYSATGRPALTDRPSGATTFYGFDGIGRLSGLGHSLSGGHAVNYGYSYTPAGQMAQQTRDNDAYAFAGFANGTSGYVVNGLNRYTSVSGTLFAYDANGNFTSDGGTTYAYDAENRLIGASGAHTAQLAYDPLGRLWQTSGGAAGVTRFLYDDDQLVAEYDGAGTVLRRYIHGPGDDDPLVWFEGGSLASTSGRYLMADHQGSIVAATDVNGTTVATNSYDEYGRPGAGNLGRFGYTGQAWLPELGLWHYKARVYSPHLGRFLQSDPVGYDDQVNLHAYVANDPVNRTDPTGTQEADGWATGMRWAEVEARGGPTAEEQSRTEFKQGVVVGAVVGTAIATRGFGIPALVRWAGRAIGLTSNVSRAYSIASQGGRHSGFLRNAMERTSAQLQRSVRNGEARASEHLGYVRDPAKAVAEKGGNWGNMTQQQRDGLVNFWRKEADNYKAQADIARDVLRMKQ